VPVVRPQASFPRTLRSVELSAERLRATDAVVITTDHSVVDYAFVARHARLILDTRNATRGLGPVPARIVKL